MYTRSYFATNCCAGSNYRGYCVKASVCKHYGFLDTETRHDVISTVNSTMTPHFTTMTSCVTSVIKKARATLVTVCSLTQQIRRLAHMHVTYHLLFSLTTKIILNSTSPAFCTCKSIRPKTVCYVDLWVRIQFSSNVAGKWEIQIA